MARFALIVASLLGFLLTVALGNLLVPLLSVADKPRRRFRSDGGPVWRPRQRGVPTMGGLCFILGTLTAVGVAWVGLRVLQPELFGSNTARTMLTALFGAFLFGAVGFVDDFIKVVRRGMTGLHWTLRLALETAAAVFFVAGLVLNGSFDTGTVLPFLGYVPLGVAAYPLTVLLLVALAESARVSDSADGLCCGVAFVAMLALVVLCVLLNYFELALFPAALAGALLGFLLWNFAPAKILSGATGSLFLAGALASVTLAIGWAGIALLLGVPFFIEGASVLLQWGYYYLSHGKRLFRTAPLHHRLSVAGWSDTKLIYAFCGMALCCAGLALLFVRVS